MISPTSTASEPPRYPPPVAGIVLFLTIMAAGVVSWFLPRTLAMLSVPVLILVATAYLVMTLRVDAKKTLLLRLPSAPDFFMAIPLTISLFILEEQLTGLFQIAFPLPDIALDEARRLVTANSAGEWIVKVAALGIGASISEEVAFRGFIQTAFSQKLRRTAAIVSAAVLFTLLHFPFLPVLIGALALGVVAAATRSIVVPIFIHFCNNVATLLLFNVAGLETLGDPVWIPPAILLPAVVLFALSSAYYLRLLEPEPTESEPEAEKKPRSEPDSERITIAHEPKSIAEELSSVPRARRRLGWLVVASAMMGGVLVLLGLFGWSVHMIFPERVHASAIRVLEQRVNASLETEASDKASELSSAFRALDALNESGQVELLDLIELARAHAALNADGGLDVHDADALVETIRVLVMERTTPRTF